MFKKLKLATFATFAICLITAQITLAFDRQDIWAGGGIIDDQYQEIKARPVGTDGGKIVNVGTQDLCMWGTIYGLDGIGKFEGIANQGETLKMSKPITGGELFTDQQAVQKGELSLEGQRANAWVKASNGLDGLVKATLIETTGYIMGSENTNKAKTEGRLFVRNGSAGYIGEVVNENGHDRALTLPGGTATDFSYTGIRSSIKLGSGD